MQGRGLREPKAPFEGSISSVVAPEIVDHVQARRIKYRLRPIAFHGPCGTFGPGNGRKAPRGTVVQSPQDGDAKPAVYIVRDLNDQGGMVIFLPRD